MRMQWSRCRPAWAGLVMLCAQAASAQGPEACAAYPERCLYVPSPVFSFSSRTASLSYRDITKQARSVELALRIPETANGEALPVVLWSPEAGQYSQVQEVLAKWNETTARAGYLSVAVLHTVRDSAELTAFCESLTLEGKPCPDLRPYNWDWPQDLKQVINWLAEQNDSGDLRGRIDMRRIAVAGHSDGANASVSLAGATRLLNSDLHDSAIDLFTDRRPVAFVALSPQGPNVEGFYDADVNLPATSWMSIERPVLLATSRGDNNCLMPGSVCVRGDTPSRRRIAFDLMPEGGKYQMFAQTVQLSHEFLATLDTATCAGAGMEEGTCAAFSDWLRSSVVAFLDAQLRGAAGAERWLREGLAAVASGGVVEWSAK